MQTWVGFIDKNWGVRRRQQAPMSLLALILQLSVRVNTKHFVECTMYILFMVLAPVWSLILSMTQTRLTLSAADYDIYVSHRDTQIL